MSTIAVWAAFLAVFLALFVTIFVAFRAAGKRSGLFGDGSGAGSGGGSIVVTGPSMAPTFWGPNAEIVCPACGILWKVHWQADQRPQSAKPITCWNCGDSVPIDGAVEFPGDRVTVGELGEASLRPGDLVAIAAENDVKAGPASPWFVKRVAAIPGQTISHDHGWLRVDDRPLRAVDSSGEPLWVGVHDDSFRKRGQSWWRPRDAGPAIAATESGFVFEADAAPTPWLDYHHFAVHDAMRPDVVRDDVPGNATEVRPLVRVDSLSVTFFASSGESAEIEVAFVIGEATATLRRKLPPGPQTQRVSFDDAVRVPLEKAGPDTIAAMSDNVPVSIRLLSGHASVTNLVVWRPLHYRIDPRVAARQAWPIRLGAGEYYLLGDNVPLSIDSRDWGPIPLHRIVGRIYAVGYDDK